MYSSLEQKGVFEAVMFRFENRDFPESWISRNWLIEARNCLEFEMEFLEEVFTDTQQYKSFVDTHPEFQMLYARVAHLYNQIASAAMENEKRIEIPGEPPST